MSGLGLGLGRLGGERVVGGLARVAWVARRRIAAQHTHTQNTQHNIYLCVTVFLNPRVSKHKMSERKERKGAYGFTYGPPAGIAVEEY